jgi:dihydroflavonol-4-reductase
MKVLVTGANGHIGSNLVRVLSERGYDVVATVRSLDTVSHDDPIASLPRTDLKELDIRDADRYRSLCDQIDILFHLGADDRAEAPTSNEDIIADSMAGAEAAIRAAARQVGKVIFTSSLAAVPLRRPGEPPATEADWQTDFSVPYFRVKTMAEHRAWELAEKYSVNLVTLLPGAVCGPGFTRATPSTDVIEGIMLGTLRFGAPRLGLPVVDVRDVIRGHVLAAEQAVNGRFILCGDSFPTLRELVRLMREIDGTVPRCPAVLPDMMGPLFPYLDWLNSKLHDSPVTLTPELVEAMLGKQFNASNARAREELGWSPEIRLQQTLADTMATIRALRRNAGRKM